MPSVDFYTKQQTDALLPSSDELVPSTSGASTGDVLTVGSSGAEWSTPTGAQDYQITNLPLSNYIHKDSSTQFTVDVNLKIGLQVNYRTGFIEIIKGTYTVTTGTATFFGGFATHDGTTYVPVGITIQIVTGGIKITTTYWGGSYENRTPVTTLADWLATNGGSNGPTFLIMIKS